MIQAVKPAKRLNHTCVVLLLLAATTALCILAICDVVVPLRVSLAVIYGLGLFWLARLDVPGGGTAVLPRTLVLCFVMNYVLLAGFVASDTYAPFSIRLRASLAANPAVMNHLGMVGLLGLLSIGLGAELRCAFGARRALEARKYRQSSTTRLVMNTSVAVLLSAGSILLSWFGSARGNLFANAYQLKENASLAKTYRVSGANILNYALMLVLLYDALQSHSKPERWRKSVLFGICAATHILVFQLLKGDREFVGFVIAAIALLWRSADRLPSLKRLKGRALVAGAVLAFICVILEPIRNTFHMEGWADRVEIGQAFQHGLTHNTGTGVVLANLGLSTEAVQGGMTYLHGATYLDLLKSLPPGFLADLLHVERPYDDFARDPAMRYAGITAGGLTAPVVPYLNFGYLGVVFVLALHGYMAASLEIKQSYGNFWAVFVYLGVLMSSLRWYWYGDIYLVRGVMAAWGVGVLYRGPVLWLSRSRRASARYKASCEPLRAMRP